MSSSIESITDPEDDSFIDGFVILFVHLPNIIGYFTDRTLHISQNNSVRFTMRFPSSESKNMI